MLILDEIQTGIGRLGTLFGYQLYGVEPDVITLAKGLAGGVPIGALLSKEFASVFAPGDHGGTFGGNPLACAAGFAVMNHILDNDIVGNARKVGEYLKEKLTALKQKYSFITDVRGRGLLLAVEFKSDIGPDVLMVCIANGLLVNKVKPNAIRLIPPLIITQKEADEAVSILDKVFSEIGK